MGVEDQLAMGARPGRDATPPPLALAQEALRRGAWEEAQRRFEDVLSEEESPEALEGLGEAAWWLEQATAVFAARERAFRLFRERGDRRAAGRVATGLGSDYAVFRAEAAVSNGWLQRAHRLLDDLEPVPEQVWLSLTEAELTYHGNGDLERVRDLAERAKGLAADLGLFDPGMIALAIEGLALVGLGRVADGMRRLDEATAAAVAGEMASFQSVAATMCVMVFACEQARDVDRASQWCERYMAFCQRTGLDAQLALCRVQYASVLTARGRWDEAERQLAQALDGLRCRIAWTLTARERLGELRRRQGRLDEADDHFERIRFRPAGVLGKARVALDRDDPQTALEAVERLLRRAPGRGRLERIDLFETLVGIHCARADVVRAEGAMRELEAGVGPAGTAGPAGVAPATEDLALLSHRRGQVALTAGDAVTARGHLEDSLDLYDGSRLPFEAALVRLDLGRALQAVGRRRAALDQYEVARASFQRLGAGSRATRAEALADELARANRATSGMGRLSPREAEVLGLLTRGLSNEEIATALVLSKHTVRRHVSSILTKLDVPSRTAAAVHALGQQHA